MNQRSIAFRLMLLYAGTLLLAGIGFSFFTVTSFEYYTHATLENVVSTRARDVWNVIQGSLDNTTEFTELIERRFSPAAEDRFIRVSIGGRVIYRSGVPADRAFDPGTIALPSPAALPKTYQLKKLVIYTNRFVASDGVAVLIESGQTDISHGLETSLITSLAIGLPILLSIAAIGGYVLIRRALSPVERMIGAAEEITFNNPRNRLPLLGTADRIEALGLALNRMLDRLDNAYQHASRFSADAASSSPIEVSTAATSSGTSHPTPAVANGLTTGTWVVNYWTDKSSTTSQWTPPGSVTQRAVVYGTGTAAVSGLLADSGAAISGNSYPAETAGTNVSSGSAVQWTVGLAAAP